MACKALKANGVRRAVVRQRCHVVASVQKFDLKSAALASLASSLLLAHPVGAYVPPASKDVVVGPVGSQTLSYKQQLEEIIKERSLGAELPTLTESPEVTKSVVMEEKPKPIKLDKSIPIEKEVIPEVPAAATAPVVAAPAPEAKPAPAAVVAVPAPAPAPTLAPAPAPAAKPEPVQAKTGPVFEEVVVVEEVPKAPGAPVVESVIVEEVTTSAGGANPAVLVGGAVAVLAVAAVAAGGSANQETPAAASAAPPAPAPAAPPATPGDSAPAAAPEAAAEGAAPASDSTAAPSN